MAKNSLRVIVLYPSIRKGFLLVRPSQGDGEGGFGVLKL